MKKILVLIFAITALVACNNETSNYQFNTKQFDKDYASSVWKHPKDNFNTISYQFEFDEAIDMNKMVKFMDYYKKSSLYFKNNCDEIPSYGNEVHNGNVIGSYLEWDNVTIFNKKYNTALFFACNLQVSVDNNILNVRIVLGDNPPIYKLLAGDMVTDLSDASFNKQFASLFIKEEFEIMKDFLDSLNEFL